MKAVKGNKQYTIDETQKKFYQNNGYDIIDDDGKISAYGRGKTVPYDEYVLLKKELETLKAAEHPEETNEDVMEILVDYAADHNISLGKVSTITGAVNKIKKWKQENQGKQAEAGE